MACLREPCPSAWLIKRLCSKPCPPVDGMKEETNASPCLRLAIPGDVCKTNVLPHLPASPPASVLSCRKPGNLDKEAGRGSLGLSCSVFALMRGDRTWRERGPRPAPEENPETTQRWVSSVGGPTTPRLSQNEPTHHHKESHAPGESLGVALGSLLSAAESWGLRTYGNPCDWSGNTLCRGNSCNNPGEVPPGWGWP